MSSARNRTRSPGSKDGCCAACADPDAGGSGVRLEPLDAQLAEQQALAADPIFHEQDRGLEVVRGAPIQHRRVDQVRAQGRDREAEQNDDEAEQAWRAALECVGGQSPPRPGQQQCGQQQAGRTEPERRLERQREIGCDAGAEPDRQPQQPALALGQQVGDEPGEQFGARRTTGRRRPWWRRARRDEGADAPSAVSVLDHRAAQLMGTAVYLL